MPPLCPPAAVPASSSGPEFEWFVDLVAGQERGQQFGKPARVEPAPAGDDLLDRPPPEPEVVLHLVVEPLGPVDVRTGSGQPYRHHHLVLQVAQLPVDEARPPPPGR